uniref:Putative secreted peptide n=1 Tax=Anopheles braziliensis TaxID=58242 RepID=A0A2M3ZW65_9DIPT
MLLLLLLLLDRGFVGAFSAGQAHGKSGCFLAAELLTSFFPHPRCSNGGDGILMWRTSGALLLRCVKREMNHHFEVAR